MTWSPHLRAEIAGLFRRMNVFDRMALLARGDRRIRVDFHVIDLDAASAPEAQRPLNPCSWPGCEVARAQISGARYCAVHARARAAARRRRPDLPCRWPGCSAYRVHKQGAGYCHAHSVAGRLAAKRHSAACRAGDSSYCAECRRAA